MLPQHESCVACVCINIHVPGLLCSSLCTAYLDGFCGLTVFKEWARVGLSAGLQRDCTLSACAVHAFTAVLGPKLQQHSSFLGLLWEGVTLCCCIQLPAHPAGMLLKLLVLLLLVVWCE